jgi:hypothetical protein
MILKINEDYRTSNNSYQGKFYFYLVTRKGNFQFRWFTDCGDWFLYIHIGKNWWRFGSCGFLKNY